jgi:type II secretory pathway predicted ATPase ExeA
MAYEKFFGFKEAPFRLTPDPAYYFPSDVHKEALHNLLYSIRAGEGFVQITGAPGTGKTLTLRTLLMNLKGEVNTALILNPRLSPKELLRVILEDLGLDPTEMQKKPKEELLRSFREFLLSKAQKGINVVVIIDEAQNLPNETLEELRLLSNLETEKKKLLQIILVGQLELEQKLESPELKQLNQRITIRYRLTPLNKRDTMAYIRHRIRIAGGGEKIRFPSSVLGEVHRLSRGIPRLINILCERALMAAFVEEKNSIQKDHVKKALESVKGEKEIGPNLSFMRPATIGLIVLILIAVIFGSYRLIHKSEYPPKALQPRQKKMAQKTVVVTAKAPPKKEVIPDEKVVNVLRQEATAAPPPITKPVSKPGFPDVAFHVPDNKALIVVDRSLKIACVWSKEGGVPILKAQFDWVLPLNDGLFILGKDVKERPFIFNHFSFFWGNPHLMAAELWKKVDEVVSENVVPLMIYSSQKSFDTSVVENTEPITLSIQAWADAWRAKDIDRYTHFYGNIFTMYHLYKDKPLVYSWEQLHELKKAVFSRSGNISLELSDPLCIVDPSNPSIALAMFYQRYNSRIYSDEGIKALYFSLVDQEEGPREWKMVAKLWIPY